ncbi:ABC transporter permease [Moraxella sp. Pampa]|uniref:ABC transporter permease n=1 Tax=Moraxella sp. Pampa TaxID=3111978 RepID=UPI002B4169B7|nr:ABC transporter permease [Moraxella sp. Pampa]
MKWLKTPVVLSLLLLFWQLVVMIGDLPHYILPGPKLVFWSFLENYALIWQHAKITLVEILLGLGIGVLMGVVSALILSSSKKISSVLLPILVISQAIPVFAIAPLLVLWFGYGIASKIVMTVLIIYFPVTAGCFDGLRQTPKTWLDIAKTYHITPMQILFKVKLPAALPALTSGLRIAICIAPIGAVVGEWVGSSQGLGYLMLHANARMQVDLMFVALFVLLVIALILYFLGDYFLKRLAPWAAHIH